MIFWKNKIHPYNEYPTINLEAYKLFTIPPTSAEVERDFSMSKAVLAPGRASMRSEVKNQAIIVHVNDKESASGKKKV